MWHRSARDGEALRLPASAGASVRLRLSLRDRVLGVLRWTLGLAGAVVVLWLGTAFLAAAPAAAAVAVPVVAAQQGLMKGGVIRPASGGGDDGDSESDSGGSDSSDGDDEKSDDDSDEKKSEKDSGDDDSDEKKSEKKSEKKDSGDDDSDEKKSKKDSGDDDSDEKKSEKKDSDEKKKSEKKSDEKKSEEESDEKSDGKDGSEKKASAEDSRDDGDADSGKEAKAEKKAQQEDDSDEDAERPDDDREPSGGGHRAGSEEASGGESGDEDTAREADDEELAGSDGDAQDDETVAGAAGSTAPEEGDDESATTERDQDGDEADDRSRPARAVTADRDAVEKVREEDDADRPADADADEQDADGHGQDADGHDEDGVNVLAEVPDDEVAGDGQDDQQAEDRESVDALRSLVDGDDDRDDDRDLAEKAVRAALDGDDQTGESTEPEDEREGTSQGARDLVREALRSVAEEADVSEDDVSEDDVSEDDVARIVEATAEKLDSDADDSGSGAAKQLGAATEVSDDGERLCDGGAGCEVSESEQQVSLFSERGPPDEDSARKSDDDADEDADEDGDEDDSAERIEQVLEDRIEVDNSKEELEQEKKEVAAGQASQAEYDEKAAEHAELEKRAAENRADVSEDDVELVDEVVDGHHEVSEREKELAAEEAQVASGAVDQDTHEENVADFEERRDDVYEATDELMEATDREVRTVSEDDLDGEGSAAGCDSDGAFTACGSVSESADGDKDSEREVCLSGVSSGCGASSESGGSKSEASCDDSGCGSSASSRGSDGSATSASARCTGDCGLSTRADRHGSEASCDTAGGSCDSRSRGSGGDEPDVRKAGTIDDADDGGGRVEGGGAAVCEGSCRTSSNVDLGETIVVDAEVACEDGCSGEASTTSDDTGGADSVAGTDATTSGKAGCRVSGGDCAAHSEAGDEAADAVVEVACTATCNGKGTAITSGSAGRERASNGTATCVARGGACEGSSETRVDDTAVSDGGMSAFSTAAASVDCGDAQGCSGEAGAKTDGKVTGTPAVAGGAAPVRETSAASTCSATDGACTTESESHVSDTAAGTSLMRQWRGAPGRSVPSTGRELTATGAADSQVVCAAATCTGRGWTTTSGSASGDVAGVRSSTGGSSCTVHGAGGTCSGGTDTTVADRAPAEEGATAAISGPVSLSNASAAVECSGGTGECGGTSASSTSAQDTGVTPHARGTSATADCTVNGGGCTGGTSSAASSAPDFVVTDPATGLPVAGQPTAGPSSTSSSSASLVCPAGTTCSGSVRTSTTAWDGAVANGTPRTSEGSASCTGATGGCEVRSTSNASSGPGAALALAGDQQQVNAARLPVGPSAASAAGAAMTCAGEAACTGKVTSAATATDPVVSPDPRGSHSEGSCESVAGGVCQAVTNSAASSGPDASAIAPLVAERSTANATVTSGTTGEQAPAEQPRDGAPAQDQPATLPAPTAPGSSANSGAPTVPGASSWTMATATLDCTGGIACSGTARTSAAGSDGPITANGANGARGPPEGGSTTSATCTSGQSGCRAQTNSTAASGQVVADIIAEQQNDAAAQAEQQAVEAEQLAAEAAELAARPGATAEQTNAATAAATTAQEARRAATAAAELAAKPVVDAPATWSRSGASAMCAGPACTASTASHAATSGIDDTARGSSWADGRCTGTTAGCAVGSNAAATTRTRSAGPDPYGSDPNNPVLLPGRSGTTQAGAYLDCPLGCSGEVSTTTLTVANPDGGAVNLERRARESIPALPATGATATDVSSVSTAHGVANCPTSAGSCAAQVESSGSVVVTSGHAIRSGMTSAAANGTCTSANGSCTVVLRSTSTSRGAIHTAGAEGGCQASGSQCVTRAAVETSYQHAMAAAACQGTPGAGCHYSYRAESKDSTPGASASAVGRGDGAVGEGQALTTAASDGGPGWAQAAASCNGTAGTHCERTASATASMGAPGGTHATATARGSGSGATGMGMVAVAAQAYARGTQANASASCAGAANCWAEFYAHAEAYDQRITPATYLEEGKRWNAYGWGTCSGSSASGGNCGVAAWAHAGPGGGGGADCFGNCAEFRSGGDNWYVVIAPKLTPPPGYTVDEDGNLVRIPLDPDQRNAKGGCLGGIICWITVRGADGKVKMEACFSIFCDQMSVSTPGGEVATYEKKRPNKFEGYVPVEPGGQASDMAAGTEGMTVARDINGRGQATVTGTGSVYDGKTGSYTIYDQPSRPGNPYVADFGDVHGAPFATSCPDGCWGALSNGVQTDRFVIKAMDANAELVGRDMAGNPATITWGNAVVEITGHEGWTVTSDGNADAVPDWLAAGRMPSGEVVTPSATDPHGHFTVTGQTGSITLPNGLRIENRADGRIPTLDEQIAGALPDKDGHGGFLECTGLCAEYMPGDAPALPEACGKLCQLHDDDPKNNDRICTGLCTMRDQFADPDDPKAPNGYFYATMLEDGNVGSLTVEGDMQKCHGQGCWYVVFNRDEHGNGGGAICSAGGDGGMCSGANREGSGAVDSSYIDEETGKLHIGGSRILYQSIDPDTGERTHAGVSCSGGVYCSVIAGNAYGWTEEEWKGDIDDTDVYDWMGDPDASWLVGVDANSDVPVFGPDTYMRPSMHNEKDDALAESLGLNPDDPNLMLPPLSPAEIDALSPEERAQYEYLAPDVSHVDLALASLRVIEGQSNDRYITLHAQRAGGHVDAATQLTNDITVAAQDGLTDEEVAAFQPRIGSLEATARDWAAARGLINTIDGLTWTQPLPLPSEEEIASDPEVAGPLAELYPPDPGAGDQTVVEQAQANVNKALDQLGNGGPAMMAALYLQAQFNDLMHQQDVHQAEIDRVNAAGGAQTQAEADQINARSDAITAELERVLGLLGPAGEDRSAVQDTMRRIDQIFADATIDQEWAGRVEEGDALIDQINGLAATLRASGDPNQIALADDIAGTPQAPGVLSTIAAMNYEAITRSDGQRAAGIDFTLRLPSSGMPDVTFAQEAAINLPDWDNYKDEARGSIDQLSEAQRVALASQMTVDEYLDRANRPIALDSGVSREQLKADFTDEDGDVDQAKLDEAFAVINDAIDAGREVLSVNAVVTDDGEAVGNTTVYIVQTPDGVRYVKGCVCESIPELQQENELYDDDMHLVFVENALDVEPVRRNADGTYSHKPGGAKLDYGTFEGHRTPWYETAGDFALQGALAAASVAVVVYSGGAATPLVGSMWAARGASAGLTVARVATATGTVGALATTAVPRGLLTAQNLLVSSSVAMGGRAAWQLGDRAVHGKDINPFTNAEARNLWLDGLSVGLGVAAGPVARAGTRASSTGGYLASQLAAGAMRGGSNYFDAASWVDSGATLANSWEHLDWDGRIAGLLGFGFEGVQMRQESIIEHNFRSAAAGSALKPLYGPTRPWIPGDTPGAVDLSTIDRIRDLVDGLQLAKHERVTVKDVARRLGLPVETVQAAVDADRDGPYGTVTAPHLTPGQHLVPTWSRHIVRRPGWQAQANPADGDPGAITRAPVAAEQIPVTAADHDSYTEITVDGVEVLVPNEYFADDRGNEHRGASGAAPVAGGTRAVPTSVTDDPHNGFGPGTAMVVGGGGRAPVDLSPIEPPVAGYPQAPEPVVGAGSPRSPPGDDVARLPASADAVPSPDESVREGVRQALVRRQKNGSGRPVPAAVDDAFLREIGMGVDGSPPTREELRAALADDPAFEVWTYHGTLYVRWVDLRVHGAQGNAHGGGSEGSEPGSPNRPIGPHPVNPPPPAGPLSPHGQPDDPRIGRLQRLLAEAGRELDVAGLTQLVPELTSEFWRGLEDHEQRHQEGPWAHESHEFDLQGLVRGLDRVRARLDWDSSGTSEEWPGRGSWPDLDGLIPRTESEAESRSAEILAAVHRLLGSRSFAGFRVAPREGEGHRAYRDLVEIAVVVLHRDNGPVGEATLLLRRDPLGTLHVEIDYVGLDSGSMHGNGFTTTFVPALVEWFAASGVDRVTLRAVRVGGYLWALRGFDWLPSGEHDARAVLDRLRGEKRSVDAQAAELRRRLTGAPPDGDVRQMEQELADLERQSAAAADILGRVRSSPFGSWAYPTPYEIALTGWNGQRGPSASWIGKRAMIGAEWRGVLWIAPEGSAPARASRLRSGWLRTSLPADRLSRRPEQTGGHEPGGDGRLHAHPLATVAALVVMGLGALPAHLAPAVVALVAAVAAVVGIAAVLRWITRALPVRGPPAWMVRIAAAAGQATQERPVHRWGGVRRVLRAVGRFVIAVIGLTAAIFALPAAVGGRFAGSANASTPVEGVAQQLGGSRSSGGGLDWGALFDAVSSPLVLVGTAAVVAVGLAVHAVLVARARGPPEWFAAAGRFVLGGARQAGLAADRLGLRRVASVAMRLVVAAGKVVAGAALLIVVTAGLAHAAPEQAPMVGAQGDTPASVADAYGVTYGEFVAFNVGKGVRFAGPDQPLHGKEFYAPPGALEWRVRPGGSLWEFYYEQAPDADSYRREYGKSTDPQHFVDMGDPLPIPVQYQAPAQQAPPHTERPDEDRPDTDQSDTNQPDRDESSQQQIDDQRDDRSSSDRPQVGAGLLNVLRWFGAALVGLLLLVFVPRGAVRAAVRAVAVVVGGVVVALASGGLLVAGTVAVAVVVAAARSSRIGPRTRGAAALVGAAVPAVLAAVLFPDRSSTSGFAMRGGLGLVQPRTERLALLVALALVGTFVVNLLALVPDTVTGSGLDAWIAGLYAVTMALFGLNAANVAFNLVRGRGATVHPVVAWLVTWVAFLGTSNAGNLLLVINLGWVAFDPLLLTATVALAVAFAWSSLLGARGGEARFGKRYIGVMAAAGALSLLYWGVLDLWSDRWIELVGAGAVVAAALGVSKIAAWRARLIHSPPVRSVLAAAVALLLGTALVVGLDLARPVAITALTGVATVAVLWVLHRFVRSTRDSTPTPAGSAASWLWPAAVAMGLLFDAAGPMVTAFAVGVVAAARVVVVRAGTPRDRRVWLGAVAALAVVVAGAVVWPVTEIAAVVGLVAVGAAGVAPATWRLGRNGRLARIASAVTVLGLSAVVAVHLQVVAGSGPAWWMGVPIVVAAVARAVWALPIALARWYGVTDVSAHRFVVAVQRWVALPAALVATAQLLVPAVVSGAVGAVPALVTAAVAAGYVLVHPRGPVGARAVRAAGAVGIAAIAWFGLAQLLPVVDALAAAGGWETAWTWVQRAGTGFGVVLALVVAARLGLRAAAERRFVRENAAWAATVPRKKKLKKAPKLAKDAAHAVLAVVAGVVKPGEVAARLGVSRSTVTAWRDRFLSAVPAVRVFQLLVGAWSGTGFTRGQISKGRVVDAGTHEGWLRELAVHLAKKRQRAAVLAMLALMTEGVEPLLVAEPDADGRLRFGPSRELRQLLARAPPMAVRALLRDPGKTLGVKGVAKLSPDEFATLVFGFLRRVVWERDAVADARAPTAILAELMEKLRRVSKELLVGARRHKRDRGLRAALQRLIAARRSGSVWRVLLAMARAPRAVWTTSDPMAELKAVERRLREYERTRNELLAEQTRELWSAMSRGAAAGYSRRTAEKAAQVASKGWVPRQIPLLLGLQTALAPETSLLITSADEPIADHYDLELPTVKAWAPYLTMASPAVGLLYALAGDRMITTLRWITLASAAGLGGYLVALTGGGSELIGLIASTVAYAVWDAVMGGPVRAMFDRNFPVRSQLEKVRRSAQLQSSFKLGQLLWRQAFLGGLFVVGFALTHWVALGLALIGTLVILNYLRGGESDGKPRNVPSLGAAKEGLRDQIHGSRAGVRRLLVAIPMGTALTGLPMYALGGGIVAIMYRLIIASGGDSAWLVGATLTALGLSYLNFGPRVLAWGLGTPPIWTRMARVLGTPGLRGSGPIDSAKVLVGLSVLGIVMVVPTSVLLWLVPTFWPLMALMVSGAVFTGWARTPHNDWTSGSAVATLVNAAKGISVMLGVLLGNWILSATDDRVREAVEARAPPEVLQAMVSSALFNLVWVAAGLSALTLLWSIGVSRYRVAPSSMLDELLHRLSPERGGAILAAVRDFGWGDVGSIAAIALDHPPAGEEAAAAQRRRLDAVRIKEPGTDESRPLDEDERRILRLALTDVFELGRALRGRRQRSEVDDSSPMLLAGLRSAGISTVRQANGVFLDGGSADRRDAIRVIDPATGELRPLTDAEITHIVEALTAHRDDSAPAPSQGKAEVRPAAGATSRAELRAAIAERERRSHAQLDPDQQRSWSLTLEDLRSVGDQLDSPASRLDHTLAVAVTATLLTKLDQLLADSEPSTDTADRKPDSGPGSGRTVLHAHGLGVVGGLLAVVLGGEQLGLPSAVVVVVLAAGAVAAAARVAWRVVRALVRLSGRLGPGVRTRVVAVVAVAAVVVLVPGAGLLAGLTWLVTAASGVLVVLSARWFGAALNAGRGGSRVRFGHRAALVAGLGWLALAGIADRLVAAQLGGVTAAVVVSVLAALGAVPALSGRSPVAAVRSLLGRLVGGGSARSPPADIDELKAARTEIEARSHGLWSSKQREKQQELRDELDRLLKELEAAGGEQRQELLAAARAVLTEFDRWVPIGRVARWRAQLLRSHRWVWLTVAALAIGVSAAGVFGTPVLGGPALVMPGFIGFLAGLAVVGPWWGYLERRWLALGSLALTGVGFGVFGLSVVASGLAVVAAVLLGFAGAGYVSVQARAAEWVRETTEARRENQRRENQKRVRLLNGVTAVVTLGFASVASLIFLALDPLLAVSPVAAGAFGAALSAVAVAGLWLTMPGELPDRELAEIRRGDNPLQTMLLTTVKFVGDALRALRRHPGAGRLVALLAVVMGATNLVSGASDAYWREGLAQHSGSAALLSWLSFALVGSGVLLVLMRVPGELLADASGPVRAAMSWAARGVAVGAVGFGVAAWAGEPVFGVLAAGAVAVGLLVQALRGARGRRAPDAGGQGRSGEPALFLLVMATALTGGVITAAVTALTGNPLIGIAVGVYGTAVSVTGMGLGVNEILDRRVPKNEQATALTAISLVRASANVLGALLAKPTFEGAIPLLPAGWTGVVLQNVLPALLALGAAVVLVRGGGVPGQARSRLVRWTRAVPALGRLAHLVWARGPPWARTAIRVAVVAALVVAFLVLDGSVAAAAAASGATARSSAIGFALLGVGALAVAAGVRAWFRKGRRGRAAVRWHRLAVVLRAHHDAADREAFDAARRSLDAVLEADRRSLDARARTQALPDDARMWLELPGQPILRRGHEPADRRSGVPEVALWLAEWDRLLLARHANSRASGSWPVQLDAERLVAFVDAVEARTTGPGERARRADISRSRGELDRRRSTLSELVDGTGADPAALAARRRQLQERAVAEMAEPAHRPAVGETYRSAIDAYVAERARARGGRTGGAPDPAVTEPEQDPTAPDGAYGALAAGVPPPIARRIDHRARPPPDPRAGHRDASAPGASARADSSPRDPGPRDSGNGQRGSVPPAFSWRVVDGHRPTGGK